MQSKLLLRKIAGFQALTAVCLATAWQAHAVDLHVAPSGKDSNPGTPTAPLQSLASARDAARKFAGKEPVNVHVADGVYYLPDTLAFTPADSGTAKFPVIFRADNEGKAVLSGGLKLDLKWESHGNGIFKAATPAGLAIDQVFIDGKRQRMARYPNFDPSKTTSPYQGFAADAFSKERAAKWADPAGGYIHAVHVHRWGGYHYRITGKNPDGSVAYEGGWQNNRQMGMHKDFRMVENIFEELDAPGEWFHDAKSNTLFYMPEPGTDLSTATVEVVRLRHLVEFQGSVKSPVRHVTLKGFTFRHAARTFMDTKEPLLRSDWTIYRGGAMLLTGTENVSILDSEFDQVGGNAVFVNHYNRRALIKGCHIHEAGASGVCFVGDPAAVRDPLFEYAQTQDLTKIDRIPGPKTGNYPAESTVEDCLIHGIGRVERQPAGVQISMSYKITVRDTSIYDCARAGINVSEGTWGGHLIERCDVFDTVLETSDHGSFNSWGRDRFWASEHRGVSEPEVKKDPKLPYLDAMKTTIIRDSRWRCDHGWDIDLDDGSSNYEIYNNLMLAGGLKFREGYGRNAYNNVLVNNGLHPHVWFEDSGSEFRRNIVMAAHAGVRLPQDWTRYVNSNFFTSEQDRLRNLNAGADANSLSRDPMFIDPSSGDFRVKDDSPALKVGFKNFPMDQFGVKKAKLKAIAKTPEIPSVKNTAAAVVQQTAQTAEPRRTYWLGASLAELEGEGFSAFGVSKEDGGIHLTEVPEGSAATRLGLRKDDLIQSFNGRKVTNIDQLLAAFAEAGEASVELKMIRDQKAQAVVLRDAPHLLVESAGDPGSFVKLTPPSPGPVILTTNLPTKNDALSILTDGILSNGYGPVFDNRVSGGAYKMDLAAVREVTSITSWSFNQDGRRGRQIVTLFGSASDTDPGWETGDASKFTPLGTIDTSESGNQDFLAASLRSRTGSMLGKFRWIVWQVSPLNSAGENTAFQELAVGTTTDPK